MEKFSKTRYKNISIVFRDLIIKYILIFVYYINTNWYFVYMKWQGIMKQAVDQQSIDMQFHGPLNPLKNKDIF